MTQKILIMEDDPKIFELLDPFLTKNGFKTIFAQDNFEGLLQFEKEHPHLVLLNLIQTCREI